MYVLFISLIVFFGYPKRSFYSLNSKFLKHWWLKFVWYNYSYISCLYKDWKYKITILDKIGFVERGELFGSSEWQGNWFEWGKIPGVCFGSFRKILTLKNTCFFFIYFNIILNSWLQCSKIYKLETYPRLLIRTPSSLASSGSSVTAPSNFLTTPRLGEISEIPQFPWQTQPTGSVQAK